MIGKEEICFNCFILVCLFFVVPMRYNDPKRIEVHGAFKNGSMLFLRPEVDSAYKIATERISKLQESNGASYGMTKFSLMPQDEFKNKYLRFRMSDFEGSQALVRQRREAHSFNVSGVPIKFDWREKGLVTSVKTQFQCGACWAFSTVGVLETMYAKKTGKLVDLSSQQVLDCAVGNFGCFGGDTCSALAWMSSNTTRIVPEEEYPLTFKMQRCKAHTKSDINIRVAKNFTCSNFVGSEEEIIKGVATHGPLAVAVDGLSWQDYLGGIIRYNCESHLNHAAEIVGYDLSGPIPYYIVKNSWGADFGIEGYLHIEIGKNLCGLAMRVSALDVLIL
ncbi:cathepsin O-like [Artemia franciscana]|uniref:Peptidase C1A papain C-terminal domain-containing protein n=1 Tax=Artemia franciscana TaxID=6661 RepID=A0AA88I0H6_ARTSF|nr:hypothetical protein QYM36_010420 [Artemia franciscana]